MRSSVRRPNSGDRDRDVQSIGITTDTFLWFARAGADGRSGDARAAGRTRNADAELHFAGTGNPNLQYDSCLVANAQPAITYRALSSGRFRNSDITNHANEDHFFWIRGGVRRFGGCVTSAGSDSLHEKHAGPSPATPLGRKSRPERRKAFTKQKFGPTTTWWPHVSDGPLHFGKRSARRGDGERSLQRDGVMLFYRRTLKAPRTRRKKRSTRRCKRSATVTLFRRLDAPSTKNSGKPETQRSDGACAANRRVESRARETVEAAGAFAGTAGQCATNAPSSAKRSGISWSRRTVTRYKSAGGRATAYSAAKLTRSIASNYLSLAFPNPCLGRRPARLYNGRMHNRAESAQMHGTTVLCVRKADKVVLIADGQVTDDGRPCDEAQRAQDPPSLQ